MVKAEILQNVEMLLNDKGIKVSATALDFLYEDTVQYVLNYCNLYELPKELYYTVAKMIINECERQTSSQAEINSISEGGRSVSFVNKLEIKKEFDKNTKEILNKYKVLYK